MSLERWAELIAEERFDGWLVADFRRNNPILLRLLGLGSGAMTRRCFLWLPPAGKGKPMVLASQVDGHTFRDLDCRVVLYQGFDDMCKALASVLPSGARIAMEYSENGVLPTVSRVDAGLIEFVRSCGVSVASSGALIARVEEWSEEQRALHRRAAQGVDDARRQALNRCREALGREEAFTEGDLSNFIAQVLGSHGLVPGGPPEVALGPHSADPHYSIGESGGPVIGRDSVLLIDFTAKVPDIEGAPYADTTWMSYTGAAPPDEVQRIFTAVRRAQDAAVARIVEATRSGTGVTGYEVDVVARALIANAGLGAYLLHRTGHSLGTDHVHGMGTNLDSIEFPDRRPLLAWTGFTIEPGVYLRDRFGVRLEVSTMLTPDGLEITTEGQRELTLLG